MLEGCVSSWVAKQEYEAFAGRVVEGPSYRRYRTSKEEQICGYLRYM